MKIYRNTYESLDFIGFEGIFMLLLFMKYYDGTLSERYRNTYESLVFIGFDRHAFQCSIKSLRAREKIFPRILARERRNIGTLNPESLAVIGFEGRSKVFQSSVPIGTEHKFVLFNQVKLYKQKET